MRLNHILFKEPGAEFLSAFIDRIQSSSTSFWELDESRRSCGGSEPGEERRRCACRRLAGADVRQQQAMHLEI